MKENLERIKANVESLVVGPDTDIQQISQECGFAQLETLVPRIKKTAETAIRVVEKFLPFHKKIEGKLITLNDEHTKNKKKAEDEGAERRTRREALASAKQELNNFKLENQLNDSDIKSTWLSFTAVMIMVTITIVEMLLSYTALYEYFDGLGTIVGVNGGLGIAASFLAMLAGQLITISLRIKKEIKKYNRSGLMSRDKLPKWVQEHKSVYEKEGGYYYRSGIYNFFIICAMFFCAVLTVFKFITPLLDGNTMAWIITIAVITSNLTALIIYEYITYSGLDYPIRLETDKFLRKVSKLQEQANKKGTESVEEVTRRYDTNKASLKQQYEEEYVKVEPKINDLRDCEENLSLCMGIVTAFEAKTNETFDKLKSNLKLPTYQKIVKLF